MAASRVRAIVPAEPCGGLRGCGWCAASALATAPQAGEVAGASTCADVLHHAGCTEQGCMGACTKTIPAGCQLAAPGHSRQLTTEGQSRV